MKKKYLDLSSGSWKRGLPKSLFYITASAMLASSLACSSDSGEVQYEDVKVSEPTKGVITTVKEVEPGKYSIVDEKVVEDKAQSKFIIQRLNGEEEVMGVSQASLLVDEKDKDSTTVHNNHVRHGGSGLGSILWWSGMGYMMGRNMSSNSYNGFYRPGVAGVSSDLRSSSVTRTVSRPVSGGRSGFFRSSSRGSFSS
jgi:hypothetical protein